MLDQSPPVRSAAALTLAARIARADESWVRPCLPIPGPASLISAGTS